MHVTTYYQYVIYCYSACMTELESVESVDIKHSRLLTQYLEVHVCPTKYHWHILIHISSIHGYHIFYKFKLIHCIH